MNPGPTRVSVFLLRVTCVLLLGVFFNHHFLFVARGSMNDLPSGPSGGFDGGFNNSNRRPGRFADGGTGGAASGPIVIDQSRLPTCAPYTAFIGNLPFDIAEADIRTFFQMRNIAAGSILNVKLPRDIVENKSRGFGYVEFGSCEDLTRALLSSNQFSIRNRVVRVDLSDSKPQNEREVRPAETNRNWRDGATGSASVVGSRMSSVREDRPVSVAEASHNWRDGAKPVAVAQKPFVPAHSAPAPAAGAVRYEAPVSAVPAGNWRDSAKPVEKAPQAAVRSEAAPIQKEKLSKPAPSEPASKVPAGTWRRSNA